MDQNEKKITLEIMVLNFSLNNLKQFNVETCFLQNFKRLKSITRCISFL